MNQWFNEPLMTPKIYDVNCINLFASSPRVRHRKSILSHSLNSLWLFCVCGRDSLIRLRFASAGNDRDYTLNATRPNEVRVRGSFIKINTIVLSKSLASSRTHSTDFLFPFFLPGLNTNRNLYLNPNSVQ